MRRTLLSLALGLTILPTIVVARDAAKTAAARERVERELRCNEEDDANFGQCIADKLTIMHKLQKQFLDEMDAKHKEWHSIHDLKGITEEYTHDHRVLHDELREEKTAYRDAMTEKKRELEAIRKERQEEVESSDEQRPVLPEPDPECMAMPHDGVRTVCIRARRAWQLIRQGRRNSIRGGSTPAERTPRPSRRVLHGNEPSP